MNNEMHLIRRIRNGDKDALAEVYRKHKDRLLTRAICLLADRAAAEDCLQDVFLKLVRDAVALRVRSNLAGYLSSCVLNRARDELRKDGRELRVATAGAEETGCTEVNPTARLEGLEESTRILRALALLPFEQREVVVLHLEGDETFRRIGVLQSVSINTVQSRYRYGIQRLRELLTEKEEE